MDSCQVHLGTTVPELEARLQAISRGLSSDSVYLHVKPVAYKDGRAKGNWIGFSGHGTMDMDVHSKWLGAKTDGKSISLAMFCTWTETWVGKKLYIWDPDLPQRGFTTRISEVLLGGQQALVDSIKAKKCSPRLGGVHVANGNGGLASQVQDCLRWIEKILSADRFPVEDFQVLRA